MSIERPLAPDPYDLLPEVPAFTLTSTDIGEGEPIADRFTPKGENVSPQLSWSGAPAETKSFVVTCFDPDAPTPSGYWHWTVANLPASVDSLDTGAGAGDDSLPGGARHARTDGGALAWEGPNPPEGDREHRYIFAVHALDVEEIDVDENTAPAVVAFQCVFHTIARARLTGVCQR